MTDKLHCPFCGADLIHSSPDYTCFNPQCKGWEVYAPREIWQALIDGKKAQDALKNSREKLAAFMHDVWGNWFAYQLNNSTIENLQRWGIQSNTPYSSLTETDKDKDRKFADKIIEIIKDEIKQLIKEQK